MSWLRDAAGWLFGGVGITAVAGGWRWWQSRKPAPPPPAPTLASPTIDQLKERARILVVDDQTFEYLPALEQEGFVVKWVKDIDSTAEVEQGAYDVVLLDLHGVATSISPKQGIGALTQIKRGSPAQMLIAYSSASWNVTDNREIELADVVLDKAQAAFPDFRQSVVKLLLRSADVNHYLACLDELCPHGLDHLLAERLAASKAATRDALLRYVKSGSGEDMAEVLSSLEERGLDPGHRPQIHAVANLARRRLNPWLV